MRGKKFFEYLGDDPEFGQIFNDSQTSWSSLVIGPVVEAYDFTVYSTIVDVAGDMASCSLRFWRRRPTHKVCCMTYLK